LVDDIMRQGLMDSFMYVRPKKALKIRFLRHVVPVLLFAILLATLLGHYDSGGVSESAAAGMMKIIQGQVYDSLGQPVVGANVTVTITYASGTRGTHWNITGSSGYYTVTFPVEDNVAIGDTINVTASYESLQRTEMGTVDSPAPFQTIDVSFLEAIPEFGGLTGIVVAVCASILAISRLGRKKGFNPW
jgi:hypothetical protein